MPVTTGLLQNQNDLVGVRGFEPPAPASRRRFRRLPPKTTNNRHHIIIPYFLAVFSGHFGCHKFAMVAQRLQNLLDICWIANRGQKRDRQTHRQSGQQS